MTGDVALAHDIGGLLAVRRLELDLTIVLINNDGGGIFHFLPVEREGADFERHVATPHGLDFAHAAALYGLRHERVDTPPSFRAALDDALGAGATISPEYQLYADAVRIELERMGYVPGGNDMAAGYIAAVGFARTPAGSYRERPPVSIGLGGGVP